MTTIINRQQITLDYENPTILAVNENVHIDDVEIEIECGPSMLKKKIEVTFHGGPEQRANWPLTLFDLKKRTIGSHKLGESGWNVQRVEISPMQEDNYPIGFSLFRCESM